MSKLKMGVIGLGYWGPNLARNINSSGDFELTMPLGINREGYVAITNTKPVPITVIAIIPEVNEK